jgi:hypothetical protein
MQSVLSSRLAVDSLASAAITTLDVEVLGPATLLPHHRRCGIRFEHDDTVTIILGMRDPRWADASSYLAQLAVARLGVAFSRMRIFYTGMQPAVRRAPLPLARMPSRQSVGAAIAAIGDLLEDACALVVEQARRVHARGIIIGDGGRSVDLIALARQMRRASSDRCGSQPGNPAHRHARPGTMAERAAEA